MVTSKPVVSFRFYNISQEEQESIKEIVQKNIDVKADSYLKSVYQNKNAVVRIEYKIQQNKQNRYEASFRFFYNGKNFVYKNKTAFKYTADLVNHAFDHFIRHLSDSRKKEPKTKRIPKEETPVSPESTPTK